MNSFLIRYFPCGERGIRTPGTSRYNGFQDRRNRPLCHLSKTQPLFKSGAKVQLFSKPATLKQKNIQQTGFFLS